MANELSDFGVLNELVQIYETDLRTVLHNGVTGAPLPWPSKAETLGALLTAGLRGIQCGLVWTQDINYAQLLNWTLYIKHSKKRFAIFTRSLKGVPTSDPRLGDVPVFASDVVGSLANVMAPVPSLTSLLYVNDRNENFGLMRRLPEKIHVFANHGDSEKHSNMSRLAAAYDFALVADSHAAQRFIQNGIQLPLDRFVPMGGTVYQGVEAARSFGPARHVLYVPTWESYGPSTNFSSLLDIGPLLAKWPKASGDLRFRPHPATGTQDPVYATARDALGTVTPVRKGKTKAEDFNWSDVAIADISGVLSEYLYTRKPIVVPVTESNKWLANYIAGTALREYVYFWDYERVSLDDILEVATRDPLREARIARRERLYFNATSTKESLELFDRALEFFEMTHRFRTMINPRHAIVPAIDPGSVFRKQPSDPKLAAIVQSVRDGNLVLR